MRNRFFIFWINLLALGILLTLGTLGSFHFASGTAEAGMTFPDSCRDSRIHWQLIDTESPYELRKVFELLNDSIDEFGLKRLTYILYHLGTRKNAPASQTLTQEKILSLLNENLGPEQSRKHRKLLKMIELIDHIELIRESETKPSFPKVKARLRLNPESNGKAVIRTQRAVNGSLANLEFHFYDGTSLKIAIPEEQEARELIFKEDGKGMRLIYSLNSIAKDERLNQLKEDREKFMEVLTKELNKGVLQGAGTLRSGRSRSQLPDLIYTEILKLEAVFDGHKISIEEGLTLPNIRIQSNGIPDWAPRVAPTILRVNSKSIFNFNLPAE